MMRTQSKNYLLLGFIAESHVARLQSAVQELTTFKVVNKGLYANFSPPVFSI